MTNHHKLPYIPLCLVSSPVAVDIFAIFQDHPWTDLLMSGKGRREERRRGEEREGREGEGRAGKGRGVKEGEKTGEGRQLGGERREGEGRGEEERGQEEGKARISELRAYRDLGTSWGTVEAQGASTAPKTPPWGKEQGEGSHQHAGPHLGRAPAGLKGGRGRSLHLSGILPQWKCKQAQISSWLR